MNYTLSSPTTEFSNLKKYFYPGFISLLFTRNLAEDIFIILKLISEFESIHEKTSDPTLALIRLKWWRDNIEETFKNPSTNSPIFSELSKLIKKYHLTKEDFNSLVNLYEIRYSEVNTDDISFTSIFEKIYKCRIINPSVFTEALLNLNKGQLSNNANLIKNLKSEIKNLKEQKPCPRFLINFTVCLIYMLKGGNLNNNISLISRIILSFL